MTSSHSMTSSAGERRSSDEQFVRTLIVLGSSLTALAVARVAHRSGLRCIMLDNTPGPAAATRLAQFRRLDSMEMKSIAAACTDLVGREEAAVVADSDRWLRFVRSHRDELAATRWLVLHPQADAIDVCLDKSAFLKWCAAHGLPAPRLYDPAALARGEHAQYPLMLRPEWTQHSTPSGLPKAIEVRAPDQLAYWLERFAAARVPPSVCESLLREGLRQFSVGAARDASGRVVTFLAEKVRPLAESCAGGTYVRPAAQEGVEALARQALDALAFFGVAEVEILFDSRAGRAFLVEINARPWLQYGLPFACGCDLMGHVLGKPAAPGRHLDADHAWMYFASDLYACFSRDTGLVSTRRISMRQYLKSLVSADVYATWDWRDPAPMLAATARVARAWLKRSLRVKQRWSDERAS